MANETAPWLNDPVAPPAQPGAAPWANDPAAQPVAAPIDLRRPATAAPQSGAQPAAPSNGFTVDVLGRQYRVDAPSQEAADRAAANVAARVGAMQPPDPTQPQVPNEGVTWDQEIDARIIDNLSRELWTQERASRPFVQKVGDWTRDLLQGATLGAGDEIVAGIDALIPGGMGFNDRLAYEQQQLAAHRAESPVMSTVTEIAGGLPWIRSPGALPSRARSFGDNVARSTGNAAAISAAYGALGTDGGLAERAQGAGEGLAVGAGIGAGIPVLGRLVAPIANLATAGLPNADRTLVNALRQSGTTGPDAAAMLRRNPNLNLADVDPNAMNLAQGIAAQPGQGRQIITDAVNLRQAGAPDRVTGIFDQSMGPTPDVNATLEGMRTTAQANANAGFGQALSGARPVNLSDTIAAIDAQLFPGGVKPANWQPLNATDAELYRIRNKLTAGGNGMVFDANALHGVQSEMREGASALRRSATGSERSAGNAINLARQNVVGAIDEATGGPPQGVPSTAATRGPYRAAQAQYASDMQVREAFDKGATILQNPQAGDAAMEARPEFWQEWANGLTPPELEAAQLGARAAVDNAIQSARNAAARGEAIPDVGFNRDRLAILFGEDEADRIAMLLGDERTMSQSRQALIGGSQTEMRRAGREAVAVRSPFSAGQATGTGVLGTAAGYLLGQGQVLPALGLAGAGVANMGRRYLGSLMDQARNAELARVIMASGPEAQRRLGSLVSPTSLRGLARPNRLVELGLAPARTAVPATTGR